MGNHCTKSSSEYIRLHTGVHNCYNILYQERIKGEGAYKLRIRNGNIEKIPYKEVYKRIHGLSDVIIMLTRCALYFLIILTCTLLPPLYAPDYTYCTYCANNYIIHTYCANNYIICT